MKRSNINLRWRLAIFVVVSVTFALIGVTACEEPDQLMEISSLAPDFTVTVYNRESFLTGPETISLSDLHGKAVVVNFWAPLCPPCRAEMPEFENIWREFKSEDLVILGVDVGTYTGLGSPDQALDFVEDIGITYPTGQASNGKVVTDYQVLGMPTTVFINADGRLIRKWIGSINEKKLRELVSELLQ
jgi:thiol-disulfide isomerase/thioredoxin